MNTYDVIIEKMQEMLQTYDDTSLKILYSPASLIPIDKIATVVKMEYEGYAKKPAKTWITTINKGVEVKRFIPFEEQFETDLSRKILEQLSESIVMLSAMSISMSSEYGGKMLPILDTKDIFTIRVKEGDFPVIEVLIADNVREWLKQANIDEKEILNSSKELQKLLQRMLKELAWEIVVTPYTPYVSSAQWIISYLTFLQFKYHHGYKAIHIEQEKDKRSITAHEIIKYFNQYGFTDIAFKPWTSTKDSYYDIYVRYGRVYQKLAGASYSPKEALAIGHGILTYNAQVAKTLITREAILFTVDYKFDDGSSLILRISMSPGGRHQDTGEKEVFGVFIRRVQDATVKQVPYGMFAPPPYTKEEAEKFSRIRGLLPQQAEALEWILSQRGIFLFTGFTNSGKSTVMRAVLKMIIARQLFGPYPNIISIEDPMEEVVPGIFQISLSNDPALKSKEYKQFLKFALTADTDVLALAETREPEDIKQVLNIAARGGVVFTTMHVGKTIDPYQKVYDLIAAFLTSEAEKKMLQSTLIGNTWQVLVENWNNNLRDKTRFVRIPLKPFLEKIVSNPNGRHLAYLLSVKKWNEIVNKESFIEKEVYYDEKELEDMHMDVALEDYSTPGLELLATIWTRSGTTMPVEMAAFKKLNAGLVEAASVFSSAAFGIPKHIVRNIALDIARKEGVFKETSYIL